MPQVSKIEFVIVFNGWLPKRRWHRHDPALALSQRENEVLRCAYHLPFVRGSLSETLTSSPKTQSAPIGALRFLSFVTPLGFEPRTHTLKVYCSTN